MFRKVVCFGVVAMLMMSAIVQGAPLNPQANLNRQWILAKAEIISLDEAVEEAKRQYKGKVLSAKKSEIKGSSVYKIKMLMPNSLVKTVFVDGLTGNIIRRGD